MPWYTKQNMNLQNSMTEEEKNNISDKNEPAIAETAANTGISSLNEAVIEALKSVYDPEIPVNIYALGLIYSVKTDEKGKVDIEMTLTSPACPVAGSLPPEIEGKIKAIQGVTECNVKVVWDPPWGMQMMSEEAKLQLNLY